MPLVAQGAEVNDASSGEEATSTLPDEWPDVILSDPIMHA
jgi:CheY-like chemotaxis protein